MLKILFRNTMSYSTLHDVLFFQNLFLAAFESRRRRATDLRTVHDDGPSTSSSSSTPGTSSMMVSVFVLLWSETAQEWRSIILYGRWNKVTKKTKRCWKSNSKALLHLRPKTKVPCRCPPFHCRLAIRRTGHGVLVLPTALFQSAPQ